jgi:hypothetical protein
MSLPAGDKRPNVLTSSNGTTTLPFSDACVRWQELLPRGLQVNQGLLRVATKL